jgi:hypothetical protein
MSLIFAALLAVQAAPAAPVTTPAPATPVQTAEAKEERKICRREMSSVGLHRSKRICLTASEWKAREGQGNADGMADAGTRGN